MISHASPLAMPLRFGECRFHADTRELRRGGEPIALSPRAFQLLTLLLQHRPRPLSHHELHDALWPDAHVGYTSLAQLVTEVRKAIGDTDAEHRVIRTVPRVGYAFVGEVQQEERDPDPVFVATLVADDREFVVCEGEMLIGRDKECAIRLPSARVSRVHAKIRAASGRIWVEDAASKNGTFVNGERRDGPTELHDGDELDVGSCRLLVQQLDAGRSTRTFAPRRRTARESTS